MANALNIKPQFIDRQTHTLVVASQVPPIARRKCARAALASRNLRGARALRLDRAREQGRRPVEVRRIPHAVARPRRA